MKISLKMMVIQFSFIFKYLSYKHNLNICLHCLLGLAEKQSDGHDR